MGDEMIIISIVLIMSSILMFLVAFEFWIFNTVLLLIATALLAFRFREKLKLKSKSERLVVKNIVTIFLVFFIIAITNFIFIKKSKDIDLTSQNIHSLTDKSKNIVSSIKSKTELILFAKRENWKPYLELLKMYSRYSSFIEISAIDPITDPLSASKEEIFNTGVLLIKTASKREVVNQLSELNITNSMLKIISNKRRNICLTSGHGEFSLTETSNYGLSFLNLRLKDNSYTVLDVNLLDPKDLSKCDIISSLGVKSDFLNQEIDNLANYLKKDGSYVLTIGPSFSNSKRVNLAKFLKTENIEIQNSVVIDRLASVYGVDATINVIDTYISHEIVKNFKDRVFLPLSTNLRVLNSDSSITPFIQTKAFPATWAENDLSNLKTGKAVFNDEDTKGPNTLALAKESDLKRIVVFSSEQFITNSYQGQSSNFNLFLNAIDWSLKEEELISLNRAGLKNETLTLASSAINTIFYFIIIVCPFIFFVIAGFIYLRNKRL